MPEPKNKNDYNEIAILEERIHQLKEVLKEKMPEEKEVLRQIIKERITEAMPLPPSPVPPIPETARTSKKIEHDELKEVEQFVDLAFSHDIPTAVKAVLKSGNAHLIDAFHDVLVDRFYDELVRAGKLRLR